MKRIGVLLIAASFLAACTGGSGADSSSESSTEAVTSESTTETTTETTTTDASGDTSSEASTTDENTTEGSGGDDIQAGTLTAGDVDDLLNPQGYKAYLDNILQSYPLFSVFPTIDVLNRVEINVSDLDGNPFVGAKVRIVTADNDLSYRMPNSGSLFVYPDFESISGTATITAESIDEAFSASLDVDFDNLSSEQGIDLQLEGYTPAVEKVDLMLVIDTTGSMGDELDYLKVELESILSELELVTGISDIRLGLTVYRDTGDTYVTRTFELTSDIDQIVNDLSEQNYGGGGDYPEAMDQALESAMAQLWREDATRVMILVADAPPHDDDLLKTWLFGLVARHELIYMVPVAASGVADSAEFIMRGLALMSHSRYIFLTDDSGVGNSHAEPSTDCYVVTRLDSTIKRVLTSIISGVRVEPSAEEIIRTQGNYQAGVCAQD